MSEISKPDFTYLWSSGGSIVAPSNVKIQTGWTAEVPPFQWENWSQNRQDSAIAHLFQKGISEWDALSNYYFTASGVRSYVQGSDGIVYVAVQDNVGQNPTTDTTDTYWKIAWIDQPALTTALNLSSPVVGVAKNSKMSVATAATTATFTADALVVAASLSGSSYKLTSFSKVINLATTGTGGMDTGSAPVSGFVGIYAIYNPTTSVSALLAVNATASAVAEIYAGVNMPAGFTASALLSVWQTNSSSQFVPGVQTDRFLSLPSQTVISSSSPTSGVITVLSVPSIPKNARYVSGNTFIASTAPSTTHIDLFASLVGVGNKQNYTIVSVANGSSAIAFDRLQVSTPQSIFYSTTNVAGTPTFQITTTGYEI